MSEASPTKPAGVEAVTGAWRAYWFDHEVHPLRINLLRVAVFTLLAFDVWILNMEHAPRYGAGGFNATQLRWLDTLLPTPGVALVGAAWLVAGYLALQAALGVAVRASVIGACLAYNGVYYWSQADSYQHHYLLGLLLILCVFIPFDDPLTRRARPVGDEPAPVIASGGGDRVKSWAWLLLKWQMSITYFYTGVTKWGEFWWDGSVMRELTPRCSPLLEHIQVQADVLGMTNGGSWSLAAMGVMVVELLAPIPFLLPRGHKALIGILPVFFVIIARGVAGQSDWMLMISMGALIGGTAYATDAFKKGWLALPALPLIAWVLFSSAEGAERWVYVFTALQCALLIGLWRFRMVWLFGLVTLPMFHILVEFLNLEIGWFSTYMLALDFILLTPVVLWRWMQRGVDALAAPLQGGVQLVDRLAERAVDGLTRWMYTLAAAACAGALVMMLPFEGVAWAAGVVFFMVVATVDGGANLLERAVAPKALTQILVAGAMVAAINATSVPFDYYRYWGGDLKRRGAASADAVNSPEARRAILEGAAVKYEKANALQAPATPARHYALGSVLDQLGRRDEAARSFAEEVTVQEASLEREGSAARKAPSPEAWQALAQHYMNARVRMNRIAERLSGVAGYEETVERARTLSSLWGVEGRKAYDALMALDPRAPQCRPGMGRLMRDLRK